MSVIQNNLLLSGDDAYNLQRSLRFRSSASAYLNRTPASAGNRKTWTYSVWVKRGSLGRKIFFSAGVNSGAFTEIAFLFTANDTLSITAANVGDASTTAVFRDPSAWYHIVLAFDTTQADAANRAKYYVNGVLQSWASNPFMAQNSDYPVNNTVIQKIGTRGGNEDPFDGYLTEINFIDGQALTPSSFGQNNSQTGVWQPKRYTGTYGTNGFYLPFSDNSSLSNLTADRSGNGNNWTANNISLSSGATYDSMTDVPTLTSATASNFAIVSPLSGSTVTAVSNGNLTMTTSGGAGYNRFGSIGITTGKFYWEYVVPTSTSGAASCGIATNNNETTTYNSFYGYFSSTGQKYQGTTLSSYGASWTVNDVIGIAFDADNGTLTFYKNNTSQGTAFTGLTGQTFFPFFRQEDAGTMIGQVNFGQRPFAYTPPTGFVALNTFNLPTPTIGATASTQAGKFFNPVLYTGNSANNYQVTGVGFQPDFTWIKSRSNALGHYLFDAVRGVYKELRTNTTDAEVTDTSTLQAFQSDGILLNSATGVNNSGSTYVAWNWKANGTGVTNTAGSITSTVSANTASGFSIVTYTGNGSNGATFGHGLGVAPSWVIVKRRNSSGDDWLHYHISLGATKSIAFDTNAAITSSTRWNNTAPSSTVVTLGTSTGVNASGATYVAYCFSQIAGYSAFGSYTGNGSSDGTFVYTGFRPRYVMIKCSSSAGEWTIIDSARDTFNIVGNRLFAEKSNAENDYDIIDFVSNGFKLREGASTHNGSGSTYIYMAFAENPFKYSLAR